MESAAEIVDPVDSSIAGWNAITYRVLSRNSRGAGEMQIDLQLPLVVDRMRQGARRVAFRRDGNAFFAKTPAVQAIGSTRALTVYYHGKPQVAKRPPREGGFIWQRDSLGHRWIATANEGRMSAGDSGRRRIETKLVANETNKQKN